MQPPSDLSSGSNSPSHQLPGFPFHPCRSMNAPGSWMTSPGPLSSNPPSPTCPKARPLPLHRPPPPQGRSVPSPSQSLVHTHGACTFKEPGGSKKREARLLAVLRAHVAQASAPLGWDSTGWREAGRVTHAPAAPRFYKLRAQPPPALSAPPVLQTAASSCAVPGKKAGRCR